MLKNLTFHCVTLLFVTAALAQEKVTISGYVKEKNSQELLPGVNVYLENQTIGTQSNNYGFYSITLPKTESVRLVFSFVGYHKIVRELKASTNQSWDVELELQNELEEVIVSANKQSDRVAENVQMSQIEIPIKQMKNIPALLGEKDVLKVLQLMPGVQKGTEGQTGIYVRGGGPDQNLLILDDATIYNANHLFGFFSVFNGDALKNIELVKGGFPARYGGRLSSVIDMQMKDGSKEKISGEGGLGLIASRLVLEGPVGKNKKASFLVSGRRTYIDVIMRPFVKNEEEDGTNFFGYFFHDVNAKLNYNFGKNDKLYLSGYFGKDEFYIKNKERNYREKSKTYWGNQISTLRWNHLYNPRLFSNISLIYSNFNFNAKNSIEESGSFKLEYLSGIRDVGAKIDFDYYPSPKHAIKFGAQFTLHRFQPSALVVKEDDEVEISIKPSLFHSLESGLYVEDVWNITPKIKSNYGLRLSSLYSNKKNYLNLEPRLAMAYKLRQDLSLKASYAIMNQFIHLLSNTNVGLPTDLWTPATDRVPPQRSQQTALGLAKDLGRSGLSLTLEGYYKDMKKIISYKEGASFLNIEDPESESAIHDWQNQVTAGRGWSYGTEILLQKKTGKFSGWIGYTLSWTKWQFDALNEGKVFYPRYDRRHDISVVGIYEISKKITCSATWVYGTGNAFTIPTSLYYQPISSFGHHEVESARWEFLKSYQDYGEKNEFRSEPYHRLDLSVQFHRQKKHHKRTWEFGLYNAYSRKNPFFYQIDTRDNKTWLQRVSIFSIIPSVSYSFKF